jgi:C4-dicarboxylate transporter, DctM subunit
LDPQLIGIIGLVVMVVLVFLKVPVGFVMIFVGFIGFALIRGGTPAFNIMGNTFYEAFSNYNFTAIPLFILMGYLAYSCGIVTQLFDTARKWVGHFTGGMAQVTIFGGAGFGAVSGSGPASTATLSKIAYPEMVRSGVDKNLAYGVIASVGPLAVMIPPSILMIVFGIITQQSIGKLLIGGLLPGIAAAVMYMIVVYIMVKRKPELAPAQEKSTFKEKIISIKGIGPFTILVVGVIAGLYSGIFTPTEAGGAGAFIVFIMLLIKEGFKWDLIKNSMVQTMKTTCMIFILVGGTHIFSYFLSVTRIPVQLSQFIVGLPVEPIIIILGVVLLYLFLGMFIEMISAMFLTLPILFPAIIALGYDPIWFGVLLVFLVEVALVTPPFGLSLFIVKGTIPGSDLKDIYKGVTPFIVADLVLIVLFISFPEIITFLPSLMK